MIDNKTVFLFDIDGVLCESQQPVQEEMHNKLVRLARHNSVYFLTGNTYTKSIDLINNHVKDFSGVFCNSADELRSMRGKLIWQDKETRPLPLELEQTLQCMLSLRGQKHYGNRVEWRNPRSINFSLIGRNASIEDRISHDPSWRPGAIEFLQMKYPEIECSIGGSISIDICSPGANKARAAKYINNLGKKFVFVGDKTHPGGNDFAVKEYCDVNVDNICLTSSGPIHTMEMIDGFLR